jgi:hypothetical protein
MRLRRSRSGRAAMLGLVPAIMPASVLRLKSVPSISRSPSAFWKASSNPLSDRTAMLGLVPGASHCPR